MASVSAALQQTAPCSVCLVSLQLDQLEREFGRLGSAGSRSAAVAQLITKEKEVQQSAVKLHSQQEQLGPQVKITPGRSHPHMFQCRTSTVHLWSDSKLLLCISGGQCQAWQPGQSSGGTKVRGCQLASTTVTGVLMNAL